MPLFRYLSLNKAGKQVSGTLDVASKQQLKDALKSQGLMLVEAQIVEGIVHQTSWWSLFESGVSFKDKLLFTKQLAVLLKSGIPLLKSIELLLEQFTGKFQRILMTVRDDLKAGLSFAHALEKYPSIFPVFYTQLVQAGELSGNLELVLNRLTTYLEKDEATRKKVSEATSYPLFLLGLAFAIVVGVLVYVVPGMKSMFAKMGSDKLPTPTQLLVDISDFVTDWWILLLIGSVVFGIGFLWWRRTEQGKYHIDLLLLKIPGISFLTKTKAVVQFCKTLGVLLESGAHLSDSLSIVCNIIDNKVLTNELNQAREHIIKEGKIARYLRNTGIFPQIATYMIQTGEESGNLAHMLMTVGNDYEVELDEITEKLVASINPIMMIGMGIIVMWVAAAIILPTLNMSSMISF